MQAPPLPHSPDWTTGQAKLLQAIYAFAIQVQLWPLPVPVPLHRET